MRSTTRKQKRFFFLLASVILVLSTLFCLSLEKTFFSHTHEDGILHEDCVICRQISEGSERTLRFALLSKTSAGTISFSPVFAILFFAVAVYLIPSPIARKDKLSL